MENVQFHSIQNIVIVIIKANRKMKILKVNNFFIVKLEQLNADTKHDEMLDENYFCSQKYRKTAFDWQPSPNKKFGSNNYQNKKRQQSNSEEKSQYEARNTLNPNESFISQVLKIKSVDALCIFHSDNKQFFSPRILIFTSRYLCSLVDKQKANKSFFCSETIQRLHHFMNEVADLNPKFRIEQIQKQQIKNLLYFAKKVLIDQSRMFHLQKESQNFNENLSNKIMKLRDEIVEIYLDKNFEFDQYEISELTEIYHELIRFSSLFQIASLYKSILNRKQKIQQNVNPQFMFSATNFMLTVKTIEFDQKKKSEWNKGSFTEQIQKSQLEERILRNRSKDSLNETKQLRQKCYEMFFSKWMYYFEDMNEFIKLSDMTNIWPVILLSNSGLKMLLKDSNGPKVLYLVNKILINNNFMFEDMISIHSRVICNSLSVLLILSKKHPQDRLTQQLKQRGLNMMKGLQSIEKNKTKIRVRSLLQDLKKVGLISDLEQHELLNFITTL